MGTDLDNFDFKPEDALYEKMHPRFLKSVLNVNKYSSNSAVRGELGRYPLNIKVWSLCIKYWHNIMSNGSQNMLLKAAICSEYSLPSSWLHSIEYTLKRNGLGYVWNDTNSIKTQKLYSLFKVRLIDEYVQTWFSNNPYGSNGLNDIKQVYEFSTYLTTVTSTAVLSMLTKLRINNSILNPFYKTNHNYAKANVCNLCQEHTTNMTQHCLLKCEIVAISRDNSIMQMNQMIKNFTSLPDEEKILIILDFRTAKLIKNTDIDIFTNTICSYIKTLYVSRQNTQL